MSILLNGICNKLPLLTTAATDLDEKARILGFDAQTLIATGIHIVTVLVVFYIIGRLLFKPVQKILNDRKENISNEYKKIQTDSEKAASMKNEYDAKLANIQKEAEAILAEARKKALQQESKIITEAKNEADRIQERARLEIEREKAQIKDDIRKEIIEVATMMASKFVAASIDEKTKDLIFEKALSEMGENTWLN